MTEQDWTVAELLAWACHLRLALAMPLNEQDRRIGDDGN